MPNENTSEYIKALYDHAALVSRGNDAVYASRLCERLLEFNDPFYSGFTLALLEQNYRRLGRSDLVSTTCKRVAQLPAEQQLLLNPNWVASCCQRSGDFKRAKEILSEVTRLAPTDPYALSTLSEISLFEGNPVAAYNLSESVRRQPETGYQLLGKMLGIMSLLLQGQNDQAAIELLWVGQFLIAQGNIPSTVWDYSELRSLVANNTGLIADASKVVLDLLTSRTTFANFASTWGALTPLLHTVSKQ